MTEIKLLQVMSPLTMLIGSWSGQGNGKYPTMEPFEFSDQLNFKLLQDSYEQEPLIHFEQIAKVKEDSEFVFKHWEAGFLRPVDNGMIELQVTHNTGRIEIMEGRYERLDTNRGQFKIRFTSTFLHNSVGLVEAHASERVWVLEENEIRCQQAMSTKDISQMTVHLNSILERVPDS